MSRGNALDILSHAGQERPERFLLDEAAVTLTETALMLLFVAMVVAVALPTVGDALLTVYSDVAAALPGGE